MKKKISLFLAAFIALVTYTVQAAIQASEPEVIFSAVATAAKQYSSGENEITSDYATFTGGKIYAVSGQSDPKDLIKTWSNAVYFCQTNNNTYFKVVLDKPLAVGDIITCDALAGVKKDSKTGEITGIKGLWVSTKDGYPKEAPACSGTDANDEQDAIIEKLLNYTVTEGSEYVGATTLYIYRAAGATEYFNNFKIIRPAADEPQQTSDYYVVGSMNNWTPSAEYKLATNSATEGEFMTTLKLPANTELKVVKVEGETTTYYPDGMDNNYVINDAGEYDIYFRPDGQGGQGWHYGYIYAAKKEVTPEPAITYPLTAKWDWEAKYEPTTLADVHIENGTGSVESNVKGISMFVDATSGKLQTSKDQNFTQFNTGTILHVPVGSTSDVVTVKAHSYNFENIKVGGELSTEQTTNHTATADEVAAGYVVIESTASPYLYSVQVTMQDPNATPEPQPVATKTINFNPGVWDQSEQEASYAAWAWGAAGEPGAWYAYNAEQRTFDIPETCAKIIFVRYNPEIQFDQLSWNDVWDKTDDLTITAGKMYEITAWGADGSNSTCVVKDWPPVTYSVNIAENIQNGHVSVDIYTAEEGSTITVTATPDEGYVLDAITVTCDNSNQAVQVAKDGTFTMPADNVTVSATFKEPSIVSYYVVGTMTKWQIENTFQLLPSKTEEGLYEYYGTFAAKDEIKVLGDNNVWYPEGENNNYVFAEAGEYKVSFRPAGNIEGWVGGYFNVVKQGGDDPQPTTDPVVYAIAEKDWVVENGALTNGTVSFPGEGAANFKKMTGYFIMGKKDAYINFPKYDFDVEKIVVQGNSGASASTKMNIFVGDNAVSTETVGSTDVNTYEIAADYQAAGTQYTLKVTSAHNAQITKIAVYPKGSGGGGDDPQPAEPVFIVVGQPQAVFGGTQEWDTKNDAHKLEEKLGKYYCTFTNVAPQEQNIELKVYNMANGAWFGAKDTGKNIVFNMKDTGDFTVALDVTSLDNTKGYIWVKGDNVVFPETPDPQPTGESFTIKFKDNGAGSSDGTAAKTAIADLIADGADYVQATKAEKAYNGKEGYGVKLSSSSANGSMTLTLAQSVKPTKITFKASAWVNSNGVADAASISINGKAAQELTDELAEYAVDYDGETEISEITIAATKRAYISEVTVFYGDGGGDTPAVDTYGIVGDLTGSWDKDLMMTVSPNDANIYTATVEGVEIAELKGYDYKLRANKSWEGYQIPTKGQGNQTWKPEAVGVYTFTFTANIAENTLTVDAQKTADIKIIANTPETALTVAQAIELVGKTDATVLAKDYNKVYIKGTATDIGTVNEDYHSLTYYLTDGENKIQIYSGKYLNGADFDQDKADALKDKVVTVYGNLKLFNGTPEVYMNNIIYSIEGEEPVADTWTVAGSDESLFGTTWDPANTANDMQLVEGRYTWQKTDVAIPANSVVKFKVVKNHAWSEAYPDNDYVLTIDEQGTYTITITFDAESKAVNAVATKTGGADLPDATIDVVQLLGEWNGWNTIDEAGMPALPIMTKGEGNVWTGVLDLSAVTADQQFKLMINKKNWVGVDELTLVAGELVSTELGTTNNFILKNATSGYQTYDITATWQANPNAAAGWTLTIDGKDKRVEPQPQLNDYSVQFVNNRGWDKVNAYVWDSKGQQQFIEWPGAEMTLINEQATYDGEEYPVYELHFQATAAPDGILFNNGGIGEGNQTEDLAFENGKRYIVLNMKGEILASTLEPLLLNSYGDQIKLYSGMPKMINGVPSETETVAINAGDVLHFRVVGHVADQREFWIKLMSDEEDSKAITEAYELKGKQTPHIVSIPITGAVYELLKDEQHKVRLNGLNVFIDRLTVEHGVYEQPTEENTISVWVPESEEGDAIQQDETVKIPATSFIVSDVKEEEVVKIKASTVEPNPIIAKRRALAATDISIMKKGSSDVKLVEDANIRVSEDGSGYEFTVSDEATVTELKTNGFDIKNNTAKNIKIKAVEVQKTGSATAVSGVKATIQKGAQIYTINGQRVDKAQKGLYIVNGKKVVIK